MKKLVSLNQIVNDAEEQGLELDSILVNPAAVFSTENPDEASFEENDVPENPDDDTEQEE
jgi:hypothetical protein